jgi:hypothetical protein
LHLQETGERLATACETNDHCYKDVNRSIVPDDVWQVPQYFAERDFESLSNSQDSTRLSGGLANMCSRVGMKPRRQRQTKNQWESAPNQETDKGSCKDDTCNWVSGY